LNAKEDRVSFSESYVQFRALCACVREDPQPVSEHLVQCIWYDQVFREDELKTTDGLSLRVLSPGWWNHQEGPDFRGAQIEFNGRLHNGDVEIHLQPSGWRAHGHHLDSRYNDVILHVVMYPAPKTGPAITAQGQTIAQLCLSPYLPADVRSLAEVLPLESYAGNVLGTAGKCADLVEQHGADLYLAFLELAGEWRMLSKARALRERIDHVGPDQALYESFMYACGFSHFKHHFRAIARNLPYERARQLALEDPLLLEAALFRIGGLLPATLPRGTTAIPHFARLRALRRDRLPGLRTLPLHWRRVGVRPNNNPERRLSGAARFIARTATSGLASTLDTLWREKLKALERRRSFEKLFPAPMGFWSSHCTWAGQKMSTPSSSIGPGRVRSIIGNVFIPAALAMARKDRDRIREEQVFQFFAALPKEPDNRITKTMIPRILGGTKARMSFRRQQGLLQMYQDWCESNPSCRNCSMMSHFDRSNVRQILKT